MTENERLFNAIGLCQKAGRLVSGDESAEKCVRAGKAKLVLLDRETSASTQARYAGLCDKRQIPWILTDRLGAAIGNPARKIAAVIDGNFQKMITDAYAALAPQRATAGVEGSWQN